MNVLEAIDLSIKARNAELWCRHAMKMLNSKSGNPLHSVRRQPSGAYPEHMGYTDLDLIKSQLYCPVTYTPDRMLLFFDK